LTGRAGIAKSGQSDCIRLACLHLAAVVPASFFGTLVMARRKGTPIHNSIHSRMALASVTVLI